MRKLSFGKYSKMNGINRFLVSICMCAYTSLSSANGIYIDFKVNPSQHTTKLYLKNQKKQSLGGFGELKKHIESKDERLIFAMNAGIYMENLMPLGLFVENGQKLTKVNIKKNAYGNFYLQPNGVFLITNKSNYIVSTDQYITKHVSKDVLYATQSGPMLVIDGAINQNLAKLSKSKTIRNGVCIDKQGSTVFSISKASVSFLEFAEHFRDDLACANALYFDGAISQAYWPERNIYSTATNLGPMVGVTLKK